MDIKNIWLCAESATMWLRAAHEMHLRYRQVSAALNDVDERLRHAEPGDEYIKLRDRGTSLNRSRITTEFFFLEAVRISMRWVSALAARDELLRDDLNAFLSETDGARHIRDRRAHMDEDLLPERKRSDKPAPSPYVGTIDGGLTFLCDATSTIVDGGGDVLFGGKVSQRRLVSAIDRLLPKIEANLDHYALMEAKAEFGDS